jgi:transposase/FKBP-type peptidyl-prolyl cis-trans isomerase
MSEQSSLFPWLPESRSVAVQTSTAAGTARVLMAQRNQIALRPMDLEATVGAEHAVRDVWAFVERLDLSVLYAEIGSVEGRAGRAAIDPRILMALWLYATVDGVGSAREIERLTEAHDAYRWICGGVNVNHHTLSDFRCARVDLLDELLTQSVAVLANKGLVKLERVAQDGLRVRASAGTASFRRRLTLEWCLKQARAQVQALKGEIDADANASNRRRGAARQRAAEEHEKRLVQALEQLAQVEKQKKKKTLAKKENETEEQHQKRTQPRASSTDAEARVMKMADGGFRPAYNVQFTTTTNSQIIVGVEVNNCGSDLGQLSPMLDQVEKRYGGCPAEWLADGAFASNADIEDAHRRGTTVYAPVRHPRDPSRDPHVALPDDSEALAQWRQRMGSDAAKEIYKQRAATAECVNAIARGRGLTQFLVRGLDKVKAVALWYALAHNLMRAVTLAQAA